MTQSCVAALVKGTAINDGLRLVLSHLWASDMHTLYVTPHWIKITLSPYAEKV